MNDTTNGPTKVFLVEEFYPMTMQDEHDDHRVVGVFSSLALAEAWVAVNPPPGALERYVSEWVVDSGLLTSTNVPRWTHGS